MYDVSRRPVNVHDRCHHGSDERGGVEGDCALEPVRGLKRDDVPRPDTAGAQPGGGPSGQVQDVAEGAAPRARP